MADETIRDPFEIDTERLDQEWVDQPKMYNKYALKSADADDKVTRAKAELDVVEAEVALLIRKKPEKYGLIKGTDKEINSAVTVHKRYREAQDALHEVIHTADIFRGKLRSLEHRKRALEKLTELRLANYFSEPRISKQAKEAMDEADKDKAFGKKKKKPKGDD